MFIFLLTAKVNKCPSRAAMHYCDGQTILVSLLVLPMSLVSWERSPNKNCPWGIAVLHTAATIMIKTLATHTIIL
jgi:hypothetical protein